MNSRRPTVADVIDLHGVAYTRDYHPSRDQRRVLDKLAACRTARLGGHRFRCDRCGHEKIVYNSCRNRHCPRCQAQARANWLRAKEDDLLPVPYFHVVFTLPEAIGPVALQNKRVVYDLLFQAASQTLAIIAKDPQHLGAKIGTLAVLHTWGQNLLHHPHLHCVVPGGGLSPDGSQWIACRRHFFLPVRVLGAFFRGRFLRLLQKAYDQKRLCFHGQLASLAQHDRWRRFLAPLRQQSWVVYAKPPFGGPRQVLRYLASYTHRVAISNGRIVSVDNGKVRFRWKDYRRGHEWRVMTLDAQEFLRRFLLHIFPKGFQRIRSYGLLANRVRRLKLAQCRSLLQVTCPEVETNDEESTESAILCPICRQGHLHIVATLKATAVSRGPPQHTLGRAA